MTVTEDPTTLDLWERVATIADLEPDRGRAALLDDGQVALFLVGGNVYAIGNRDPFSGANVLARGIVGDRAGEPKVSSPVYKQSFSLLTGQCLDQADVAVPVYDVQVDDRGVVAIRRRAVDTDGG